MFGLRYALIDRHPDIEFTTGLPVDECRKRLKHQLEYGGKFSAFSLPIIVERLEGNHFVVSKNTSLVLRDNFLVLDGQLKSTTDGTHVVASLRLYEGTSALLILSFGLFFGLAVHDASATGDIGIIFIPIIIWTLIGLSIWIAWQVAKSSRNGLVAYLKTILPPIV